MGFSGARSPARESLIALASCFDRLRPDRRPRRAGRVEILELQPCRCVDTWRGGICAMLGHHGLDRRARRPWRPCRARACAAAPASSSKSIALSGSRGRWRYAIGERGRGLERLGGVGDARGTPRSAPAGPSRICVVSADARLADFDLLEAPRERAIALEVPAVLLERGRADAAELARGERGLEQVRRVHRAAASRAGAHHGVDLVDEEDRAPRCFSSAVDHGLEALFEIAAELGAGEQRAHVERVDRGADASASGTLPFVDASARCPRRWPSCRRPRRR